jgi:hypothetical protein
MVTGLIRRAVVAVRRWSAGRRARRVLACAVGLACAATLAVVWAVQGQFRGW